MTQQTKGAKVRRIYEICFTGLTIVVGLLFIVQVWALFSMGEKAFSRASVAEHFTPIAPFFFLWLAGIVGGAVLGQIFPAQKTTLLPVLSKQATLKKLSARVNENVGKSQQTKRKVVWLACVIVASACAVVATLYLAGNYVGKAQSGFFAEHNEAERLVRAMPWFLGLLCAIYFADFYGEYSTDKEIKLVKAEIVENAKKGIKIEKAEQTNKPSKFAFLKTNRFLWCVRGVLGVLAIALIVLGIDNGGMADVLEKAINICTQCIGLG